MTSLVSDVASEVTNSGVSTIADTWIQVSYLVRAGERNRAITIIKSRGTSHSKQVRELVLSKHGIDLADVYLAGGEVLMGTLRWQKELAEMNERHLAARKLADSQREAELAVAEARARLAALELELRTREATLQTLNTEKTDVQDAFTSQQAVMRRLRTADLTVRKSGRARNGRPEAAQ